MYEASIMAVFFRFLALQGDLSVRGAPGDEVLRVEPAPPLGQPWSEEPYAELRIASIRNSACLQPVARLAKPDTILAWYRRLVAEKFDGSKQRRTPGRPRPSPEIEDLWFAWLARTPAGATTGLWEHWPTWDIP